MTLLQIVIDIEADTPGLESACICAASGQSTTLHGAALE
jgi:hypothetical protein